MNVLALPWFTPQAVPVTVPAARVKVPLDPIFLEFISIWVENGIIFEQSVMTYYGGEITVPGFRERSK